MAKRCAARSIQWCVLTPVRGIQVHSRQGEMQRSWQAEWPRSLGKFTVPLLSLTTLSWHSRIGSLMTT